MTAMNHLRLDLARLKLKGRFDLDEIDEAVSELIDKDYIDLCEDHHLGALKPGHEHCWRLLRAAR